MSIDGDGVAAWVEPADMNFDALERRVHIAHGAAAKAFFTHDVPRL